MFFAKNNDTYILYRKFFRFFKAFFLAIFPPRVFTLIFFSPPAAKGIFILPKSPFYALVHPEFFTCYL